MTLRFGYLAFDKRFTHRLYYGYESSNVYFRCSFQLLAKDINNILSDIKEHIVGLSEEKAREILFSYPEISSFVITIRPPWYTTVSKLKSRIDIYVNGKTIK